MIFSVSISLETIMGFFIQLEHSLCYRHIGQQFFLHLFWLLTKIVDDGFCKLRGVERCFIPVAEVILVRTPCSSVYSSAFSMMAAFSIRPRWRSIAIPLSRSAVGLAIFFPAISGAVP